MQAHPDSEGEPVPVRELVESRLKTLKAEYDKGQVQLQRLQSQLTSLQETMLRISGAITVLEELLASPAPVTRTQQQTLEAKTDPHPAIEAA